MKYDNTLSVDLNIELNHVPTTLDKLRDVWEGYDVQETIFSNGEMVYDIFGKYEHFNFDCQDKTWWAYDGEDVGTITIDLMDKAIETGRILGWW